MRNILSTTALAAVLALPGIALAQTAGTTATTPGTPTQAQAPAGPLPMTQPAPGTATTTQRPSTAAGALGATAGQPAGAQPGITQPGPSAGPMGQTPGAAGSAPGAAAAMPGPGGHPLPPAPGATVGQPGITQPGPSAGPMGTTPGQAGTAPGAAGTATGQAGTAGHAHAMAESDVRDLLRDQGYSDVQSVSRDGNNFRARAMQNGRSVDVTVDAFTGTIRSQAAGR
jgi:hypothetical protein